MDGAGKMFDRDSWRRFMSGYIVFDCTIGFEDGRLGFLLYEEMAEDARMEDGFQIRVLAVKLANPMETRFFSMSANGLGVGARLTSAWSPQNEEFVSTGIARETYSYKPKTYKGREQDIPFEARKLTPEAYHEFDAVVTKIVRVGTTVFAVGGPLRVFERTGDQQWIEHVDIPIPAELGSADRETMMDALSDCRFEDLAGLSTSDMYAVGGAGAVWRRKGGTWTQMAFPGDLGLHTVAVAPDGTAYISDMRGSVWKGTDDQWERVVQADQMLPYQDSAWFNGRLYCANDSYGCFVLEDGQMVAAHQAKRDPMPANTAVHAYRLDVSPDGKQLLIAGMYGATLYDGKTWRLLFDGEP